MVFIWYLSTRKDQKFYGLLVSFREGGNYPGRYPKSPSSRFLLSPSTNDTFGRFVDTDIPRCIFFFEDLFFVVVGGGWCGLDL